MIMIWILILMVAPLRASAQGIEAFKGTLLYPSDRGPLLGTEFLGWSLDGRYMISRNEIGWFGLDGGENNYDVEYMRVEDLSSIAKDRIYCLDASTNSAKIVPDAWSLCQSGLPRKEWDKFEASHKTSKPPAALHSVSGKWHFKLEVQGPQIDFSTNAESTDQLLTQRPMEGEVITFNARASTSAAPGTWIIKAIATDGMKQVVIRAEPFSVDLTGDCAGYLAPYWSPKEDSIAVEWGRWPALNGDATVRVFSARLPGGH